MHRRRFIALASLVPLLASRGAVAQSVPATPVPIGEAFSVTWWEIDDSTPDFPVFRGDVENTSDDVIAAPVVGITAYDPDGNILGDSYALPDPPILEPGQRAFLYGSAPNDLPDDVVIELYTCREPEDMPSYVDANAALDLTLEISDEDLDDDAFEATGTVLNNSTEPAADVAVVAIFSNPDGRVVGALSTRMGRDIPAGKSIRWEIDHGRGTYRSDHPFTHLLDSDYTVDYWTGYSPNARMIFC